MTLKSIIKAIAKSVTVKSASSAALVAALIAISAQYSKHRGPRKPPTKPPVVTQPQPETPPVVVQPEPETPPVVVQPEPETPPVVVQPEPELPPVVEEPVVTQPPVTSGQVYSLAAGQKQIIIDGRDFRPNGSQVTLKNGDAIKIPAGNYEYISISHISVSTSGAPVTIMNSGGQITVDGDFRSMDISNINNVVITGAGTQGLVSGFEFKNNRYRAVQMGFPINNFTLRNMKFENIGDYVISYGGGVEYVPGNPATYSQNFKFLNIIANNVGTVITLGGNIDNGKYEGFIQKLEIAGLQVSNSEWGSIVWFGNVEDYDIHNNHLWALCRTNNNHNGMYALRGNGKFYNNLTEDYQGNTVRAWPHSITKRGMVEIYNNISWKSRKYGAFEIQATPPMQASAVFKPADVKIYNNTAGLMDMQNTTGYPGRLVDVYETFGTREVYNNLLFQGNDTNVINFVTAGLDVNTNNIYKATPGEAIVDLIDYATKVVGVGAVKSTFVVP